MKLTTLYIASAMVAILAAGALSIGFFTSAQTTALSCGATPASVTVGQTATFSATGGNGTYTWSGANLTVSNPTSTQFMVSYPTPGTYTITVQSDGQVANCNLVVTSAATGALACSPATQNVTLGQTAVLSATGGNGTYTWSAPELNVSNPTGSGFQANYSTVGLKTVSVMSGGQTAVCNVNVLAASGGGTTPGLPNTGAGGSVE